MKPNPLLKLLAVAALASPLPAMAVPPLSEFYLGGGGSYNQAFDDKAFGYQAFAGAEPGVRVWLLALGAELGFMGSGELAGSAQHGAWASGVARLPIVPQFSLLGRAGWDFGDDNGLLYGFGAAYRINLAVSVRGEYVQRNNTDSLQANIAIHF